MTESGPLSDDDFPDLAGDYVLFCHVDSKAEGWKYPGLRREKGLLGLPSVAYLDAAGDVLVQVPYDRRTVAGFRRVGQRALTYVRLRAATAAGDEVRGARFLLMQLEERQLDLEAATARRREVGEIVDARVREAVDRRLRDLRIQTELRAVGNEARHTLGPRFLAILREGPQPSAHVSRGFWYAIFEWAEQERDAEAFAEALRGMREALAVTDPGKPWVEPLLGRYRAKLRELLRSGR